MCKVKCIIPYRIQCNRRVARRLQNNQRRRNKRCAAVARLSSGPKHRRAQPRRNKRPSPPNSPCQRRPSPPCRNRLRRLRSPSPPCRSHICRLPRRRFCLALPSCDHHKPRRCKRLWLNLRRIKPLPRGPRCPIVHHLCRPRLRRKRRNSRICRKRRPNSQRQASHRCGPQCPIACPFARACHRCIAQGYRPKIISPP